MIIPTPHPIAKELIDWYAVHRRDLPWRSTKDPYCIWVSEIILQQTRVVQGLDYYLRFVKRFPTVEALATAPLEEVLLYWQGLGYYSRARNLHTAAQEVMSKFGGVFPSTHKEVLSLKGIGDYTAAAICSLAYKLPYAVVDGNVYRVLSRLFAIETPIDSTTGRKEFATLAQELLDSEHPDLYNQAIMDFGAMVCTPQQPACNNGCPLASQCLAYQQQCVDRLPIKQGKTKVTARYFNYLYITCQGDTWINQRMQADIWKGLFELPLIETPTPLTLEELQGCEAFRNLVPPDNVVTIHPTPFTKRHVLSHRVIHANFYTLEIAQPSPALQQNQRIAIAELGNFAVSRLTELFLESREG